MKPIPALLPEAVELEPRDTNEWLPEFTPSADILELAVPQHVTGPGYYGLPMLKRPTWGWQIALYFFFEGISSASYLIASLATLFGEGRFREVSRAGHYVSFGALVPCAPLLIADLGAPKRFHHMLRVFKPSSPMNLGAWSLLGFSLPVTLQAAEMLTEEIEPPRWLARIAARLPDRLAAVFGIPFAIIMAGYPGVLLSMTSTPIWTRSRFLGALLACESIKNGAAATDMAIALTRENRAAVYEHDKLDSIRTLAAAGEAALLGAYVITTGQAARPLTKGSQAWTFWLGAIGAGIVAPAIIGMSGIGERKRKRGLRDLFTKHSRRMNLAAKLASSALSLAGGLALKWAITHGGQESALDDDATRIASRATESNPGWNPA